MIVVDCSNCDIVEILCLVGVEIENFGFFGMFKEEEIDFGDIVNKNEVVLLVVIWIVVWFFKKFDFVIGVELVEVVKSDWGYLFFVGFVWVIDIEVVEVDDLWWGIVC